MPLHQYAGNRDMAVFRPERSHPMSMVITETCINCGNCEPVCPNKAISAGDTIYLDRAGALHRVRRRIRQASVRRILPDRGLHHGRPGPHRVAGGPARAVPAAPRELRALLGGKCACDAEGSEDEDPRRVATSSPGARSGICEASARRRSFFPSALPNRVQPFRSSRRPRGQNDPRLEGLTVRKRP